MIVSSHLIECAVRVRILQDTVHGDDAEKLAGLDELSRSDLVVATIVSGNFAVSLRETCNKIIHAKEAIPEWAVDTENGVEFRYWSGDYRLLGTKRENAWEILLHTAAWARAMARFLDEAESAELTLYVGQDWY